MDYAGMVTRWVNIADELMEDVDELRNSGERKLAKDMYDVVHALDGIVNETGIKARSLQGITERDCRRFL